MSDSFFFPKGFAPFSRAHRRSASGYPNVQRNTSDTFVRNQSELKNAVLSADVGSSIVVASNIGISSPISVKGKRGVTFRSAGGSIIYNASGSQIDAFELDDCFGLRFLDMYFGSGDLGSTAYPTLGDPDLFDSVFRLKGRVDQSLFRGITHQTDSLMLADIDTGSQYWYLYDCVVSGNIRWQAGTVTSWVDIGSWHTVFSGNVANGGDMVIRSSPLASTSGWNAIVGNVLGRSTVPADITTSASGGENTIVGNVLDGGTVTSHANDQVANNT